ncbi:unnamed protein product [Rhizophagus irregularis]|nr:unnamed protein product [Rhizophagus irregularis]
MIKKKIAKVLLLLLLLQVQKTHLLNLFNKEKQIKNFLKLWEDLYDDVDLPRNHSDQIYNAIMKALNEENSSRGLHIYGPFGLGKSYSLYYLVSELRLQHDYRVTCINNCEGWWSSHQIEPYQYLLNELLCTFNKEELTPLTITD